MPRSQSTMADGHIRSGTAGTGQGILQQEFHGWGPSRSLIIRALRAVSGRDVKEGHGRWRATRLCAHQDAPERRCDDAMAVVWSPWPEPRLRMWAVQIAKAKPPDPGPWGWSGLGPVPPQAVHRSGA